MNNFLCLCFLCPLSCYFFPPGFLPFLMQISPLRLPHLSLFYVPPLSLVIITEYCSELCFGICHDNILQFVLEKRGKEKRSETKCWVRNVWSNEAVFWSGASHVTEKSTEFTLWSWLDQIWRGWFRHMFLVYFHVLFSHSASHLRVDPLCSTCQTVNFGHRLTWTAVWFCYNRYAQTWWRNTAEYWQELPSIILIKGHQSSSLARLDSQCLCDSFNKKKTCCRTICFICFGGWVRWW